jgi:hypothetical protein
VTRWINKSSRDSKSKVVKNIPIGTADFEKSVLDHFDSISDQDVKEAFNNYQGALNRYNFIDLSNPSDEDVAFLEVQYTFVGVQLALAKARQRGGLKPSLDYSTFDSVFGGKSILTSRFKPEGEKKIGSAS